MVCGLSYGLTTVVSTLAAVRSTEEKEESNY
jgi:hypothetical protein